LDSPTAVEFLMTDVKLRRKQEWWESPRRFAIVVGSIVAVVGASWLGFDVGRELARSRQPLTIILQLPPGTTIKQLPPGTIIQQVAPK